MPSLPVLLVPAHSADILQQQFVAASPSCRSGVAACSRLLYFLAHSGRRGCGRGLLGMEGIGGRGLSVATPTRLPFCHVPPIRRCSISCRAVSALTTAVADIMLVKHFCACLPPTIALLVDAAAEQ